MTHKINNEKELLKELKWTEEVGSSMFESNRLIRTNVLIINLLLDIKKELQELNKRNKQ